MTTTILVLGATGSTGTAVVDELRRHPDVMIRTATRASAAPTELEHRRFDWFDAATWRPALDAVSRVYLIAPVGHPDPIAVVGPFAELAVSAGVRRVVLLSSSAVTTGDPGLGVVDALVRTTFPEWEILRPSWFMQNFVASHPVADGIRATGEFVTATGAGRLPFIDARDVGRSAAALLGATTSSTTEHLLTGPKALSYDEAAAVISVAAGRRVSHRAVESDRFIDGLVAAGYDRSFAEGLAALDAMVRLGTQAQVTDTVERLTGTPARSFDAFLRDHRVHA